LARETLSVAVTVSNWRFGRLFGGIHAVVPSLPTTPVVRAQIPAPGRRDRFSCAILSNRAFQRPPRCPWSALSGFPFFSFLFFSLSELTIQRCLEIMRIVTTVRTEDSISTGARAISVSCGTANREAAAGQKGAPLHPRSADSMSADDLAVVFLSGYYALSIFQLKAR
jgi:hypothetical protein